MTTIQIVDIILPLTKEDNKCGFKKSKKLRARNELIIQINDHREGKGELPEEVLMLIAQF
jgi:hypothetical protein